MARLEELLGVAIKHYQAVIEAFAALEVSGKLDDRASLETLAKELSSHQAKARIIDLELLALIEGADPSYRQLPLMLEYQTLLQRVAECNLALLNRARTHLALVGSELSELKDCKKALSGYRISPEQRGRMISEAY